MSSGRRVKSAGRRLPSIGDVTSGEGIVFTAKAVATNVFNGLTSGIKKKGTLVKAPGSKNRERPSLASMRQKKRPRQSSNKNEMDPLARAQEIQGNKIRNDRKPRSKSGKECLSPLCTSSTPPGFKARKESAENTKFMVDLCSSGCETDDERDKRASSNKTPSTPTPTRTPTPMPMPTPPTSPPLKKESNPRQSKTKSGRKKRFRANIEKKRRKLPPETPTYPSTPCPQSSTAGKDHIGDDDDTENDSMVFQDGSPSYAIDLHEQNQENEDDNNPNKNNEDDLISVENIDQKNGTLFEDQSTLKKKKKTKNVPFGQETSSETNRGSCGKEIVERSPKKKSPPNNVHELTANESVDQENGTAFEDRSTLKKKTKKFPIDRKSSSEMHAESCGEEIVERISMRKLPPTNKGFDYTVPALKPMKQKKNRKCKHYHDVDETEDKHDKEGANYLNEMRTTIRDADEANGGEAKTKLPTPRRKSNPFGCSVAGLSSPIASTHRMSQSSSNSLNLKKTNNNKRSTGKPKGKKTPKKVIPGASLQQKDNRERKDDQESHWRSAKDRDEYHNSNSSSAKMPQDGTSMDWDPMVGGYYPNGDPQNIRIKTPHHRNQCGKTVDLSPSPLEFSNVCENRSSTRRSKRNKKQKTPETINISSDSEDGESVVAEVDESHVSKFPLKRLIINNNKILKYEDNKPIIKFDEEDLKMEITYFKSKEHCRGKEKITIGLSDVEEIVHFPLDALNSVLEKKHVDLDSFLHLRGDSRAESTSTRKRRDPTNQSFLLEFHNDQHMTDLITTASADRSYADIISVGQPGDVDIIAAPLIKDSTKQYRLRKQVAPHKIDSFIANRKSDEILIVYPFDIEKGKMEAAANGLEELSWRNTPESKNQDTVEIRSHYIEIRVEDFEKLDTGQWLNDSLVDLWMQWISRDLNCKQSSDVHFFTSHFYTTLASKGVEGVKSWTARKNINIFDKRLIFIPVNKTLHWSLCVIVNPGAIIQSVDDEDDEDDRPLSCMLFFDSLNMHRKARVHKDIVQWLNYEWKRMKDPNLEPFNKRSCKIHDPKVPRQNNGSDCGVFVCRYAFAMLQLRNLKFSYREAGFDKRMHQATAREEKKSLQPQLFSDIITNGKPFNFDVNDIQRIRGDFKTLIRRLHPLYQEVKDGRIKAEKEEKKARRELRRKEKEEAATASKTNEPLRESTNDSSDSGEENHGWVDDEEAKLAATKMEQDYRHYNLEETNGKEWNNISRDFILEETSQAPNDIENGVVSMVRNTKAEEMPYNLEETIQATNGKECNMIPSAFILEGRSQPPNDIENGVAAMVRNAKAGEEEMLTLELEDELELDNNDRIVVI